MLWVDPNPLVIVSTRSSFDCGKAAPAVDRAVGRTIRHIDHVRIVGCHCEAVRSGSAASHWPLGIDPVPALAPVVGAVEPAELLSRLCQQVDPVWPARRNRQPNSSALSRPRLSCRQVLPPSVDLNNPPPGASIDWPLRISHGATRAAQSAAYTVCGLLGSNARSTAPVFSSRYKILSQVSPPSTLRKTPRSELGP